MGGAVGDAVREAGSPLPWHEDLGHHLPHRLTTIHQTPPRVTPFEETGELEMFGRTAGDEARREGRYSSTGGRSFKLFRPKT